MKLRLALLGCGMWAQSTHIPFLSGRHDVELDILSGVITKEEGCQQAKRFGFASYEHDWKKVAQNPEIDAVVISTPHQLHFEQIEHFLRGGKHVHVDKPPTLEKHQLIYLRDYAIANDLILSVHTQMKYMPGIDKIKSLIGSHFSDIFQVNAYIWQKLFADFKGSWRSSTDLSGGGIMLDSGYHMADTVHYILRSHPSAEPYFLTHTGARNASDTVGLLTYSLDNTIVSISSIRGAPKMIQGQRIEIFGDNGYIELRVIKSGDDDVSMIVYQDMSGESETYTYVHNKPYKTDPLEMFIDGITMHNSYVLAEIATNIDVSLSVIEILEKAYKGGKQ